MAMISNVEVASLRMELPRKYLSAKRGLLVSMTELRSLIIKVRLKSGEIGYGEVPLFGINEEEAMFMLKVIGRSLVGKEIFNINLLHKLLEKGAGDKYIVASAVEVAILDALGKALGQPIYNLLGGKQRAEAPICSLVHLSDPETVLSYVENDYKLGIRIFKVKLGDSPDRDVERIRILREHFGDKIRIHGDAGESWGSAKRALSILRRMDRVGGLDIIEQPVPAHDLRGLGLVTKNTETQVSVDEGLSPLTAPLIIKERLLDLIGAKFQRLIGYIGIAKACDLAEFENIQCIIGTHAMQTPILDLAGIQLYAAHDNVTISELGRSFILLGDALEAFGSFTVEDGKLIIPSNPGLGLAINEDKLSRYMVSGWTIVA